jgi:hypothetical protein
MSNALNSGKRAGKAHIQVVGQTANPWSTVGLPSPLELTFESTWRTTGADYQLYDLKLDTPTALDQQTIPATSFPDTFQEMAQEPSDDFEPSEDFAVELN